MPGGVLPSIWPIQGCAAGQGYGMVLTSLS